MSSASELINSDLHVRYVSISSSTTLAYRLLGPDISETIATPPLVMHCHFRSTMCLWDPLLLYHLSRTRPILVFDQAGVGRSTGVIPDTYQGWANDLIAMIHALSIDKIDLLGFSMGGYAAQMVALSAPNMVRKLVLAGTGPSMPDQARSDLKGIVWPRDVGSKERFTALAEKETPAEFERALSESFFPLTSEGKFAAAKYWRRVKGVGTFGRESEKLAAALSMQECRYLVGKTDGKKQRQPLADWNRPNSRNSYDRLSELNMPVLILNGDNDVLIPSSRSWELAMKISNAKLIIYPRAGHGFLYQYAELVARHISMFLDNKPEVSSLSRM